MERDIGPKTDIRSRRWNVKLKAILPDSDSSPFPLWKRGQTVIIFMSKQINVLMLLCENNYKPNSDK